MTKLVLFLSGVFVGVYIDQYYTLPKLNVLFSTFKKELKKYEKSPPPS
jgi:hypothetical protein